MIRLFLQFIAYLMKRDVSHILVALQNNNELRGGGGYISQFMDLSVGKLSFKTNFFSDQDDLDYLYATKPPDMIRKHLNLDRWFLRDANIRGDYAQSAKNMEKLYHSVFPHNRVAAIISVNFSFIEDLLKITGPIKFDGKTIDSANLFYELTTHAANIDLHNSGQRRERKSFFRETAGGLINKIVLRPHLWLNIARLFKQGIIQKDILLNFSDCKTQEKFIKRGLIIPFSSSNASDCLAVIENNFLGLKSNRYIRRTVWHDVRLESAISGTSIPAASESASAAPLKALVKVRILTEHYGPFDYPFSGNYQSHVSLAIPAAALNVTFSDRENITGESRSGSFAYFGLSRIIQPGSEHLVEFTYEIPAESMPGGNYSFKYIKQSGVADEHVFESVSCPGKYTLSSNSADLELKESVAFIIRPDIKTDYTYRLKAVSNSHHPRVYFHEMISPSSILIRFNEPVSFKKGSHTVTLREENTGRAIPVSSARFSRNNKDLLLSVDRLIAAEEQRFKVSLEGIMNSEGVGISPCQTNVTVAYRPRFFKNNS